MEGLKYTIEETVENGREVTNVHFDEDITQFKWIHILLGKKPKRRKKVKNPSVIYEIK